MSKILGFALGAGGARGVAHIGFLQAMEEEGIRPDCVAGCSMGSIVGACYCAGIPMARVREVALDLKLSRIATLNVTPLHANGLFRMTKARKLIEENLGADTTFERLKIPFCCVATDIMSGKTIKLDKGNVTDAVIASSSIPGVFSPAVMGDMLLVDGGVLERVPVRALRSMRPRPDVIVAVDVLGNLLHRNSEPPTNLINCFLRYVDVIDTRVTQQKKMVFKRHNGLWLEPDLGNMDQYQVKNLPFAYEQGYRLGKENAGAIRELIES